MNIKQRITLFLGVAAVTLMGVFPPWRYVYDFPGAADVRALRVERAAGYSSIFAPPQIPDEKTISTLFGFEESRVKEDNDPLSFQSFLEDTGRAREKARPYARYYFASQIDAARLLIQLCLAVFFISGLVYVLRRSRTA